MLDKNLLPIGAVLLAIGLTPAVSAPAAAAPPLPPAVSDSASAVVKVDRRRGRHGRRHWHRGRRGNDAVVLGLGIIGGLIASEAFRSGHYYDDDDDVYYVAPGFHACRGDWDCDDWD